MNPVFLRLLTSLVLVLALSSCTKEPQALRDQLVETGIRGDWPSENHYVNTHFDLSFDVPDAWFLNKGDEANSEVMEVGANLVSDGNRSLKKAFEEGVNGTHVICFASLNEKANIGVPNPNVNLTIQNLDQVPGVHTAEEYYQSLEKTLSQTAMKLQFKGAPNKVTLGEREFTAASATLHIGEQEIQQDYWLLIVDRHALFIAATWFAEDDYIKLQEMIGTLGTASRD